MCDAYTPAGEPLPTNKRYNAAKVFSNPDVAAQEPWYVLIYSFQVLFLSNFYLSFSFWIFRGTIMFEFLKFDLNKQVRYRAGVHLVAKRCKVANGVAPRWLSWTTGYISFSSQICSLYIIQYLCFNYIS
jgi:hypothetical protein